MKKDKVYDYVRRWLLERKIETYFSGNNKYLKMKETDFIDLCMKLVNLIESSTE